MQITRSAPEELPEKGAGRANKPQNWHLFASKDKI